MIHFSLHFFLNPPIRPFDQYLKSFIFPLLEIKSTKGSPCSLDHLRVKLFTAVDYDTTDINGHPACVAPSKIVQMGHMLTRDKKWSQLYNSHFHNHPCISRKHVSRTCSSHVRGSFTPLCFKVISSSDDFRLSSASW